MNKGLHIGVDASWVGFQAGLFKVCPHLQSLLIVTSFTWGQCYMTTKPQLLQALI